MNERERRYREARVARDYDCWVQTTPDDEEDLLQKKKQQEDLKEQYEEYAWECKRDDELTNPRKIIIEPEEDWHKELTKDEQDDMKHRMYKIEKELRWQQDIVEGLKSVRGY